MSGAVVKKFVSSQIGRSIEVLRKKKTENAAVGGERKISPPSADVLEKK
jgi:hypothetical protein